MTVAANYINENYYENMNEIEEVFNAFEYYVISYETLSSENKIELIKSAFESANFVEKTVKQFENQSTLILDQFMACFITFLRSKNRTVNYSLDFLKSASDNLLLKYLYYKTNIENAIKIYVSLYEKERFEKVVEKALLRNVLYEPIAQYLIVNKDSVDLIELKSRLLLLKWVHDYETGKKERVINALSKTLTSYSVEVELIYLLKILAMKDLTSLQENTIQSQILEEIVLKMEDRSILSKDFWLTIIKKIELRLVIEICAMFEQFLDKFICFLIYCICMMDRQIMNEKRIWLPNVKSICPEITFENISCILSQLVNFNSQISSYVQSRTEQCKRFSDPFIWNDIIENCF